MTFHMRFGAKLETLKITFGKLAALLLYFYTGIGRSVSKIC